MEAWNPILNLFQAHNSVELPLNNAGKRGREDEEGGRRVIFASVVLNSGSFSADKFNAVANAMAATAVEVPEGARVFLTICRSETF